MTEMARRGLPPKGGRRAGKVEAGTESHKGEHWHHLPVVGALGREETCSTALVAFYADIGALLWGPMKDLFSEYAPSNPNFQRNTASLILASSRLR